MDLADHWPLPGATDLRDRVAAAYAEPTRGYHDTGHLRTVLERLDDLAGAGETYEPLPVVLAAWFHDAVYDGERDAEERSAAWAEDSLAGVVDDEVRAEVVRLVRLTETHQPADEDPNGCALSDADLAVLAAARPEYDAYAAAVRVEYAHLDEPTFRAGRAQVLAGLAGKPHLFHTAHARAHWEEPARANLAREISELTDLTELAGRDG